MDNLFIRVLRQWMPLAVGVSAVCFLLYLIIQQDIRIGANDPQIQMAEDTAASLAVNRQQPLTGRIDVLRSLAPFTIVYDTQGNVVASNAFLNKKTPFVPSGALTSAKDQGESRITWQPQAGVRLASVIVPFNKGYVLVGRNMREIERREDQQFSNILLGWFLSLFAMLSCVIAMQVIFKKIK